MKLSHTDPCVILHVCVQMDNTSLVSAVSQHWLLKISVFFPQMILPFWSPRWEAGYTPAQVTTSLQGPIWAF